MQTCINAILFKLLSYAGQTTPDPISLQKTLHEYADAIREDDYCNIKPSAQQQQQHIKQQNNHAGGALRGNGWL